MARVAIVGVGAIGGVVAGLLAATGRHEITFCTRRPLEHLTVHTPQGSVEVKAVNLTQPERAQAVDWVLVATKTYDAAGAIQWLPALTRGSAPVAVLQNGVEHRERFSDVNPELLLPVIIDCPAERRGDNEVLQRAAARMQVETGSLGREFALLFEEQNGESGQSRKRENGANGSVELTDDFLTAAWRKLCSNAAGAIPALVLQPVGVLRQEALGRLAVEIVDECALVGRAEGAKLDDSIGQQVLAACRAQAPESANSLLVDRMAGRRTEIEARNGVIVRKGARHGIETPLNRMVVALVQAAALSA